MGQNLAPAPRTVNVRIVGYVRNLTLFLKKVEFWSVRRNERMFSTKWLLRDVDLQSRDTLVAFAMKQHRRDGGEERRCRFIHRKSPQNTYSTLISILTPIISINDSGCKVPKIIKTLCEAEFLDEWNASVHHNSYHKPHLWRSFAGWLPANFVRLPLQWPGYTGVASRLL